MVMVAQLCEQSQKTFDFYTLNGWILRYVNYLSLKLLPIFFFYFLLMINIPLYEYTEVF